MWWYEQIKSESPVLGTEYFESEKSNKCIPSDMLIDLNGFIDMYFPKKEKMNSIEFGIAIKKIIPNLKMTRHNNEKRKYVIPSLLECRRFFFFFYGIDFKEDNQF